MAQPAPLCLSCAITFAAFQQLEVDYYIGAPNQQVFPTDLQETPIIRMYGVTEQGMDGPNVTTQNLSREAELVQILFLETKPEDHEQKSAYVLHLCHAAMSS
jgi:hypothetical protein